ncbi:hypothetical protein D3C78_1520220 [compost metagenome]
MGSVEVFIFSIISLAAVSCSTYGNDKEKSYAFPASCLCIVAMNRDASLVICSDIEYLMKAAENKTRIRVAA